MREEGCAGKRGQREVVAWPPEPAGAAASLYGAGHGDGWWWCPQLLGHRNSRSRYVLRASSP